MSSGSTSTQAELAPCEALDPRRRGRARDLGAEPRDVGLELGALATRLVELEVQPEHRDVDRDDAREQHGEERRSRRRRRSSAQERRRGADRVRDVSAAPVPAARSSTSDANRRPQPRRARRVGCRRPRAHDGRTGFGVRTRASGSLPQTQTGSSGGQVQPFARSRRNRFTIRSSSEWKLMTAMPPAGPEHLERGGKTRLERLELVVHLDPQRLEHPLRRMPLAEPCRRRDRRTDDVDELPGPLDGLLARGGARCPRAIWRAYRSSPYFRKIVSSSRSSYVATHVRRALLVRRVHAHVERRVGRIREATLGAIDLHRREAEVEQHRVRANAVAGELREDDARSRRGGTASARRGLRPSPGRSTGAPSGRGRSRRASRSPARSAASRRECPPAPKVRVDDRLPRLHVEELAHLLREHRDVISRVCPLHVRQHLRRSLRSR